jgi:hypothetical protein
MFGSLINFFRGVGNAVFQGLKWIVNTAIGVGDVLLTLVGVMPWKKLQVEAILLVDHNGNPLAAQEDVQKALDLAKDVFAKEAKVHMYSETGVFLLSEIPPNDVLNPDTSRWNQFTGVGAWFRSHQRWTPAGTFLGYGAPVTVFIVNNVSADVSGDALGYAAPPSEADYVVVEASTLPETVVGVMGIGGLATPAVNLSRRLCLAHEVGHACNRSHRFGDGTLMQAGGVLLPKLSRWQKALFRRSPHVTYL